MVKKIVTNIESFLLIIFFFILVIILVLSNTIFNKNYLLKTLDNYNYYESAYSNLNEILKGYIIQSGLSDSVIKELYDKDKVEQDIKILIDGIYEGRKIVIDTTIIKERLETIINNQLKDNNRLMTSEDKIAINSFIDTITEVYEEEIVISLDLILKLQEMYPKIEKIITYLIFITILIISFLVITITIINKNLKETIKKISISLLTTAILLIFIKILLINKFQHILIINALFSKVLINLINGIINNIFNKGIIIGIIGLLGSIISIDYKK